MSNHRRQSCFQCQVKSCTYRPHRKPLAEEDHLMVEALRGEAPPRPNAILQGIDIAAIVEIDPLVLKLACVELDVG